jgi:hypothetical protein
MKGATLDAEQSRPASDEAFAKCFRDLVDQGRRDRQFKRLVVFVDELDRCSSEDVVATLTAIRTFLTEKHAVFVVAADRAALERALEEKLPQPTPVNEEDPYYSSASSFFDKLFHDRVPLPPLRGPRLYEWAHKKVVERGGYWAQLRGDADHELRSLLYFLIPSHVRAPRRVKVLLNSFVRSAAIAAHSGFEWRQRAREIAKLTVLDTEFPALGADLRLEPRLPELLLDPPDAPSERVARLLAKHGGYRISQGPGESNEPTTEELAAEEPADSVLAAASDEQRRVLMHAEHEQLRRYLARTRDVRIGRDLLFLERAGAALGLEDPELESLLDQAVDVPKDVVAALAEADTETRQLAARFLADMAEREFGEERVNVISALMGVVELLDEEVEPIAGEIVGSVQSFARDEGLADTHLLGSLTLSLCEGAGPSFQGSIIRDERLFSDSNRLAQVCRMLERIQPSARDGVFAALAERITGDGEEFIAALREVPAPQAGEVLSARPIYNALFHHLKPQNEEASQNALLAESVYDLAGDRGADGAPLRRAMHDLFLTEEFGYSMLQPHASEVLDDISSPEERDEQILRALWIFDNSDPEFWIDQLSGEDYVSAEHGKLGVRILIWALNGIHQQPADQVALRLSSVEALVRFAKMAENEDLSRVRDAALTEIDAPPWWSDQPSRQRQTQLHRLVRELTEEDEFKATIGPRLAADLARSVADPAVVSEETWQGLLEMGSELGVNATTVLSALEPSAALGESWPLWLARVRARLAASARRAGAEIGSEVIAEEVVLNVASDSAPHAEAAVADWLLLGPSFELVRSVISLLDEPAPPQILASFEKWSANAGVQQRTNLAAALVDDGRETSRWMGSLIQAGLDELALVERIAEQARSAARGSRREELGSALAHIRPLNPAAQKAVADLIIDLTETGKQVDFKAAVKAVPALGREHRSAGRLRTAFQQSAEKDGHQLSERAAVHLAEAGVKVPKKAVKKGAWGRFKDLF